MRLAPWLCLGATLAAFGCRERREAPRLDVAPPAPAPDAASAEVAAIPGPDVAPAPPTLDAAPDDPVPIADDPWIAFADGTVRAADAAGERDLREGGSVLPGTIIWTGEFSHAELDLPDGSLADLDEMTELLVRKVAVAEGLRRIELTLLGGAARFVVAASPEAGSAFLVSTPVGILEMAEGQMAVEVDFDGGATRVVVLAGRVVARAGAAEGAAAGRGSELGALELSAAAPPHEAAPWPELVDRWTLWDEWQADRLLDRHDLDPLAPWTRDVPALSPERHPSWAATLLARRRRVEARARELAAALGPDAPAGAEPGRLRARARDILGPQVDVARQQSALMLQRPARVERWRAGERARAERREALRLQFAPPRDAAPAAAAPQRTSTPPPARP